MNIALIASAQAHIWSTYVSLAPLAASLAVAIFSFSSFAKSRAIIRAIFRRPASESTIIIHVRDDDNSFELIGENEVLSTTARRGE